MNRIKKGVLLIYLATALTLVKSTGCGRNNSVVSRPLLGTIVTVTVSGEVNDTPAAFESAFTAIEKVQKNFNPNDPSSEISGINNYAYYRPYRVRAEVYQLIKRSIEVSENTGGAFDITFASAGKLWDFTKENFSPPDNYIIKGLLPLISYRNIKTDDNNSTIRLLNKGTKIGLGGIAKGYAVNRAVEAMKAIGVKAAIVACAGDIQVIGDNNGKPWRAGIKDPRGDSVIGTIDMQDGESVSTSGDYERFRIFNGKRYHHIINPATGYPAESGIVSASVFSSDPVQSDAYSTAFFVLGLERSKLILNRMTDLSAVFVSSDMKVYVSKKLKKRIIFRENLTVEYF